MEFNEKIKQCRFKKRKHCKLISSKCNPYSDHCIYHIEKPKNKTNYRNPYSSFMYIPTYDSTTKTTIHKNRSYNPSLSERYGNNKTISTLNRDEAPVLLYVFKGFLNLSKQHTIDYYLVVNSINTSKEYKIIVAYNQQTNRYYISDTQLKWLNKKNIYPDIILKTCNEGSVPLITVGFSECSILALYGYSAGKNGLKAQDRRKILRYVLDNKILSAYEVIEHL